MAIIIRLIIATSLGLGSALFSVTDNKFQQVSGKRVVIVSVALIFGSGLMMGFARLRLLAIFAFHEFFKFVVQFLLNAKPLLCKLQYPVASPARIQVLQHFGKLRVGISVYGQSQFVCFASHVKTAWFSGRLIDGHRGME